MNAKRATPSMALVAAVVAWAVLHAPAQERPPSEYAVKAAFLYQFGNFVEWPGAGDGTFRVCVMGTDPFGAILDRVVDDAPTIRGNRVVVRRDVGVDEARECRILFISPSEDRRLDSILENLQSGVLTVGEGARFLERGGMVAFEIEDDRVRFDINLAAAEAAGLSISSQLLGVARHVVGDPEERR